MPDCVFCAIVERRAPALIIHENANVVSFLSIRPYVYGHTLIAPKSHHADLYDVPTAQLAHLIEEARILALHYRKRVGAVGANLLHASGAAAQQSVFHFHFHLLPRFTDDGHDAWPHLPGARESREEMQAALRFG
jgi:histidine triad (HIT) family protein